VRWAWLALVAGSVIASIAAADELAVKRNLAQAALLVGDYEKAVALAEEMISQWPDDAGGHLIRGLALVGEEEYERAEGDLLLARAAYPNDTSVLYNLALISEGRGDHDGALQYLDQAIALGLIKHDAYLLKARILDRLGRRPEARATLEYYVSKRPPSRDILLTLAQWARAAGDYERAISYYEEVLKRGRNGPTLAEVAATYEAAGDRQRAVEYYLAAAAKGVATGDALAEFAADYAATGEYDQALEIYDPLVENFPHNAYYLFGRSFVKQQLGEVEEAAAGYRKATHLQPDFAEAYYNLAALADAAEKVSEAIRYYREFLNCSEGREDLAPSRERAKERLALLEGS